MEKIIYTIKDELGLHARPAGLLTKMVLAYKAEATILSAAKKADAQRIMAVLGLGIKKGDTITITFEGEDEKVAAQKVRQFLEEVL